MQWDMIGALGEIAGAAAVVLSLVYLARQVQMSNRLGRAEAWRASFEAIIELNAAFGTDAVFRQALHRVLYEGADREDLSPEARIVMGMYTTSIVNVYSQLHREVREGILPVEAVDFMGTRLFLTPFFRSSWPLLKQDHEQAFVAFLERELARGGRAHAERSAASRPPV